MKHHQQSRYFECDDSDFFMDDCYEYIEQDDDMEECSFYKYPIQQSSCDNNRTTTIVHPESCPQENLLHSNCMEMCDKEIQYDESLFEDNDGDGDSDAAAAAVTELNEEDIDWRNRWVSYSVGGFLFICSGNTEN